MLRPLTNTRVSSATRNGTEVVAEALQLWICGYASKLAFPFSQKKIIIISSYMSVSVLLILAGSRTSVQRSASIAFENTSKCVTPARFCLIFL